MDEKMQKSYFVLSLSHSLRFTGVQGRFLASLEMTIWGGDDDKGNDEMRRAVFSLLPLEGGAPKGRRLAPVAG